MPTSSTVCGYIDYGNHKWVRVYALYNYANELLQSTCYKYCMSKIDGIAIESAGEKEIWVDICFEVLARRWAISITRRTSRDHVLADRVRL